MGTVVSIGYYRRKTLQLQRNPASAARLCEGWDEDRWGKPAMSGGEGRVVSSLERWRAALTRLWLAWQIHRADARLAALDNLRRTLDEEARDVILARLELSEQLGICPTLGGRTIAPVAKRGTRGERGTRGTRGRGSYFPS